MAHGSDPSAPASAAATASSQSIAPAIGRLHDRKLDVEKLDETAVRPHVCTIFGDLLPYLFTFSPA